jgi:hypothetical protein
MIKRDFLKLFGAGLASLPFAGKLLREGLPEIKSAAKGIARTLSKVEGMPEWFSPLVNKILKNGKNISPEVKRLEDTVHVRTLKDGDTVFTLTEHPLEGEIRVEIKSPRNPHGEPVELQYKKPKKDFDPDTGKTINEPGEFQVVESEPRWTNSNDPVLELGERVTSVDKAAGDIEAAERAVTGKIKNREKIKERRKIKDQMENNPTDYIDQEYGPEPGFYQQFKNYGDYAEGGITGYQYGGGAVGYLNGGRVNFSGGSGLPPIAEETENYNFGQTIFNPNELFFGPVERNQIKFEDRLKKDPRIASGQGMDYEGTKNFVKDYLQDQTARGIGLGYAGPQYGAMFVKPYVGPEREIALQGYYNTDDGSKIQGMLNSKEQSLQYDGRNGFNFYANRDVYSGMPNYNVGINYTTSFKRGGHVSKGEPVNTDLTRTIPPVKGPNPQGVETLFKKRYR